MNRICVHEKGYLGWIRCYTVHLFCQIQQHSLTLVFNSYQVCKWQDFIGPVSDWMSRLSKRNRKSTMDQVIYSLIIFHTTWTYLSSNIHGWFRCSEGIMIQELSLAMMGLWAESSWQNHVLVSSCSQVTPGALPQLGWGYCLWRAFLDVFITLWQWWW